MFVLAVRQGNRGLAAAAALFGAVGVLQSLFTISNAVWHLTGVSVGDEAVVASLGIALLGAGLFARLRESRSR